MIAVSAEPGLRLCRLEIENFMRVRALSIESNGHSVVISGPNASGKTSVLEAIWTALRGASAKQIPEPITRGADRANITLDLGEYHVERKWQGDRTSLIVTASDGSRIKKPQELLDGLLGAYCLDPVAFLDRRSQDQVDDVLSICQVLPPVKEVAEITEELHHPKPGESADSYLQRLSGDDVGLYYHRRREANRACDQKRAALEELRGVLAGLPAAAEVASSSQIVAEIQTLQAKHAERESARMEVVNYEGELQRHQADMVRIRNQQHERLAERAELLARLKDLDQQLTELQMRINNGASVVKDTEADVADARTRLATLPDVSSVIERLRGELAQVEYTNRAAARRTAIEEQVQREAGETEKAQAEHKGLDDMLAALRHLRLHLLDTVDLGIKGLEVGQGELRLNGVSFKQASMREKIDLACAVAMRGNPKLKLLRIDNFEHLDSASQALALQRARENDFQIVAARVSDENALKVEIVED